MKKEMIRRVANRKLEARMFAPVTNFFKGDSERIDEYVQSLIGSLKVHLPKEISFDAKLHRTDDLDISLFSSDVPIVNIVNGSKVKLNASSVNDARSYDEFKTKITLEELHIDHQSRYLFGDLLFEGAYLETEEIILYENKKYSEELLEVLRVASESHFDKVVADLRDEVIVIQRKLSSQDWHRNSPFVGLKVPRPNFFNRGRLSKSTDKGVLLFKNDSSRASIEFYHDGEGFKTHFDQPAVRSEYKIFERKAKSYTFNGLLSPMSCIRAFYYGLEDMTRLERI
jgi:uncharacterized protein YihD (DUF1040 family)